jgi:DNA invertase Pin-like site-specific DNA recombinase
MTNSTKKAVIYCRNACADQTQPLRQIIQQETECRLYAEKHGYEVVQAFHDDGQSSITMNRPAFQLMLVTLLATPEPYTVITTAMDRLSRDVNDFASICKIIGGLGGELVFTSDEAMAGRAV